MAAGPSLGSEFSEMLEGHIDDSRFQVFFLLTKSRYMHLGLYLPTSFFLVSRNRAGVRPSVRR